MVSGGTEFLFWSIFFALIGASWIGYELAQLKRRPRRNVLRAPDYSTRRHIDTHFAGQP